jgi:hypothetical protein
MASIRLRRLSTCIGANRSVDGKATAPSTFVFFYLVRQLVLGESMAEGMLAVLPSSIVSPRKSFYHSEPSTRYCFRK